VVVVGEEVPETREVPETPGLLQIQQLIAAPLL
jgi:hypothetical protein